MGVGERLGEAIDRSGTSRAEFARRLGLKPARLGNYLADARKIPLDLAFQMADELDMSVYELVGRAPRGALVPALPSRPEDTGPGAIDALEVAKLQLRAEAQRRRKLRSRLEDLRDKVAALARDLEDDSPSGLAESGAFHDPPARFKQD